MSGSALIPRAASGGREAAGSPLIRDRLTLFAVRATKKRECVCERERERVQTSLCYSLLILYGVFLYVFLFTHWFFTNDIS